MTTTRITVTVATSNPDLRASLREPVAKTFARTPRGMIAAVRWADDWRDALREAQGNLSAPLVTLSIDGAEQDFDALAMGMTGDDGRMTVKAAERCLERGYAV